VEVELFLCAALYLIQGEYLVHIVEKTSPVLIFFALTGLTTGDGGSGDA
jgi:hypothetical protein